MDKFELLLKLIIPGICFLINIFCIAYSLGLNNWSQNNKAYILYLIGANFWIISDPLIFNFNLSSNQILLVTQLRPIFWLSIGLLFTNLVYELTYRKRDIFIKIYICIYIIFVFITISSSLLVKDYIYVGWYVETVPGPLFFYSIFLTLIIPALHSFYILINSIINAKSKIIKIQLSLLFVGTLLMFILGNISDIIIPFILELKYPLRLGSSIMAFQVIFAMPAILKFDLLTMSLDKFILDMFEESGDGILIVDEYGNIVNSNQTANNILKKDIDVIRGRKLSEYFNKIDGINDYVSFVTTIKGNSKQYYSISSSKLSKAGYQLGKMYLIKDISYKIKSEEELKTKQELLEKAQVISKTGNWVEDFTTNTLTFSKNCKKLLGFDENAIINNDMFWKRVHPEDKIWLKPLWKELEKKGRSNKQVYRIILESGTIRYIEEQAEIIFVKGEIAKTTGTVQDVTESYLAKRELEISETRLKEAQEVAQLGSFDYDLLDEKVVWSDELYRIYGLEKDNYNPSNKGFFNLVHQNDRKMIRDIIDEAIRNHILLEYDHRLIRSDNFDVRIMHCRAKITYNDINQPIRIAGTSQDVTNIRKAQEEVKSSREQLRKLASHLQRAQEKERARISREIHDELGQELTGIKMDISWLSKFLKKPEVKVQDRINSLNNLIDTTINSVRRISSELRPGVLDDLGLISAIEWYVEEFQNRTKINCNLKLNEIKTDIGSEFSTTLYRIVQESLTNVARHSKASKVSIFLIPEAYKLKLIIEDNGIGINNDIINYEKSLGILGMEERVNILGGTFSILGSKTKGTTIKVDIPYSI